MAFEVQGCAIVNPTSSPTSEELKKAFAESKCEKLSSHDDRANSNFYYLREGGLAYDGGQDSTGRIRAERFINVNGVNISDPRSVDEPKVPIEKSEKKGKPADAGICHSAKNYLVYASTLSSMPEGFSAGGNLYVVMDGGNPKTIKADCDIFIVFDESEVPGDAIKLEKMH